jgi:hypothetical protein
VELQRVEGRAARKDHRNIRDENIALILHAVDAAEGLDMGTLLLGGCLRRSNPKTSGCRALANQKNYEIYR